MKREQSQKNRILALIMLVTALLACTLFASCSAEESDYPTSVEELNGLRAGAIVGTIHDMAIQKKFPDSDIQYYNSYPDIFAALQSKKIDYFVMDGIKFKHMYGNTEGITSIGEPLLPQHYGVIFKKNDTEAAILKEKFNQFIAKSQEDGTIDELAEKWLNNPAKAVESAKPIDIKLNGENGTLNVAVASTFPPFSFVQGTSEMNGFDIEFAYLFAKEYGYDLKFSASDFSGVIPAVSSGKSNFGISSITITDERKESVDFSNSYYDSDILPIVPEKMSGTFSWTEIKGSFDKTFIQENRWQTIADGLKITLEISLAATILGTIIGFLIYLLCRKGNKLLNGFFDGFSWLFSGLPMVVILMILYYIIFAKSDLSGIIIAIIAFGCSVMLSVYSLLKTAVKSIDKGQIEGALSLGLTDRQTFTSIVLPQAMTQFIPNYKTTIVNMIKGTAIVGYIAVQDLTKVSDVIRSRTYDAFFPLIATALIYLIIIILITALLRRINLHYTPQSRSDEQILKQYNIYH